MSLVCPRVSFRRVWSHRLPRRCFASSDTNPPSREPRKSTSTKHAAEETKAPLSSCPAGTVLTGLNYLKGQPPALAMPDEDYPAWLWSLTKPKTYEDNGPGSEGEKRSLRKENRQHLRDKNKFGTR